MPRMSSRSSPASRTSLSDPTGSASLAMAMAGNLTTAVLRPVEGLADAPEPVFRLAVAEGADDARLEERPRIQAERGRRLVVARQIRVEHRRVVGRHRAADAGRDEPGQRVLLERAHGARAEVRERADVEHGAAVGELADEHGVLLGADAVAEPVGLQ